MRVIHLVRKPLSEGTVAANVEKHGTGGINADATRIPIAEGETITIGFKDPSHMHSGWKRGWMADPERWAAYNQKHLDKANAMGRWPANVVFEHLPECDDTCVAGCPALDLELSGGRPTLFKQVKP